MNRDIKGVPTAEYLWKTKKIIPILKVDKGLEDEKDGVQLMKPIPKLNELCDKAVAHGVFGTKMRSVIKVSARCSQSITYDQYSCIVVLTPPFLMDRLPISAVSSRLWNSNSNLARRLWPKAWFLFSSQKWTSGLLKRRSVKQCCVLRFLRM